jgi:hypothetical protein
MAINTLLKPVIMWCLPAFTRRAPGLHVHQLCLDCKEKSRPMTMTPTSLRNIWERQSEEGFPSAMRGNPVWLPACPPPRVWTNFGEAINPGQAELALTQQPGFFTMRQLG